MIYIIHKIFAIAEKSSKLKDNIFECFFKKYSKILIFLKRLIFFITYNDGKSKA